MIFLVLTDARGYKVAINVDAIGYFHRHEDTNHTALYITGGSGGLVFVTESPDDIQARLKGADAEFV